MDASKKNVLTMNKFLIWVIGSIAASFVLLYMWNPYFIQKQGADKFTLTNARDYVRIGLFAAVGGLAISHLAFVAMGYVIHTVHERSM